MPIASYAVTSRGLLLCVIAVVSVGSVAIVVAALLLAPRAFGPFSPVAYLAYLVLWGVYAYYSATRVVWLVELTESEFRWRYLLRAGAAPLSDLRSIRCAKTQTSRGKATERATVEFAGQKPLKFPVTQPGITEFLDRVRELLPGVTVVPPSPEELSA